MIAIVGWPLTYTLSPRFQNAALRAARIDARYLAFPVKAEGLTRLWEGLSQSPGFLGANVTNPHKEAACRLADRLTPEARAIGAVNTLYRSGHRWIGDNTDARGFLRALPGSPRGRRALVLGAGGTARALVYALLKSGASHVTVACRRKAQGRSLLKTFKTGASKLSLSLLESSSLESLVARAQVIVNTVPDMDFKGRLGKSIKYADCLALAFDAGYASKANPFLKAASKKAKIADGLGMLKAQGALSFRCWTSKKPDMDVINKALGD